MVVGSSFRFTSGISFATCRLANALGERVPTSALLMRRLVPRVLYPGRARVGQTLNALRYDPSVPVHDGVDWFWGLSMLRAFRFIRRQQPDLFVMQWWTGAVLHSYLLLAAYARRHGAKVVLEWHEVQDTGEARIPGVRRYVQGLMKRLLRMVDGHVLHNDFDRDLVTSHYDLGTAEVAVIGLGPWDHHGVAEAAPERPSGDVFNVLYFGVIRPYKGVGDLVKAFEALPADESDRMHLTIVGETWEGCEDEVRAALTSPRRDQITVVNRYVSDDELTAFLAGADAVALAYRRSSTSGPLHIAMRAGLPILATDVGGTAEAARHYDGAMLVAGNDHDALVAGLRGLRELAAGGPYTDLRTWTATVDAYLAFAPPAVTELRSGLKCAS
jgi:glycosyltransferase involved in cell wall biosynthesis